MQPKNKMAYGKELILDLYDCDVSKFNRDSIEQWLNELCKLIKMEQEDLHWWDYSEVRPEHIPHDEPHLVGTSVVQFITTSDIVIHALDLVGECYINIFSCKEFCVEDAIEFTCRWFGTQDYDVHILQRGRRTKCNSKENKNEEKNSKEK